MSLSVQTERPQNSAPFDPDAAAPEAARVQALMVGIADEIFAIDAGLVREIIDPLPPTRVAGARPHLPSVVNVRGAIIPLADLRVRFGLPPRAASPDTRIVVVELTIDGDPVCVGLTADKVHEVTEIRFSEARPMPRVGLAIRPDFVRTLIKWNDQFVIVPDLEAILA
ncbi:chemotaxis protein CheW [Methylobacterium indicum]|uniref:Chemotaxis protein n=1 Tax=Methylobacterium indicum TaxID=1775910 RepID=A0A8H9C7I2_9HYPH|nr:chemotaxis protein [Methylobacterium indicum]